MPRKEVIPRHCFANDTMMFLINADLVIVKMTGKNTFHANNHKGINGSPVSLGILCEQFGGR